MNTHREDCFYFSEVTDFGGHIPFCGVTAQLENCPCRDCKNYISKSDAYQVIKKYRNGEIVLVRRGDKYIKLEDAITTLKKYFPPSFERQDAEDDLLSIPPVYLNERVGKENGE